MPILPLEELQQAFPAFRTKKGAKFALRLRHIFDVDAVSDLYDRNSHYKGGDFADHLLQDIGVDYQIGGNLEVLEQFKDKPFITISNHPYGGIDGIILADFFTKVNPDYKIMVNQILSKVEALMPCCIQVNPRTKESGKTTQINITAIKQMINHIQEGHPIGLFPAGAVSNLVLWSFSLKDREWQEGIMKLVKKLRVPVVPVRFLDHNSRLFYLLGLIDWKLRTLRLPHEIANKKNAKCRMIVGKPIMPDEQDNYKNFSELSKVLRHRLYSLKETDRMIYRSSMR